MMMPKVFVGMADMKIAKPPDVLVTLGLGSCVGIVLHDTLSKLSGMVHIMLPSSKSITYPLVEEQPLKFADSGIMCLISKMEEAGARRENLVAKIAGGAHLFDSGKPVNETVGHRNIQSCMNTLSMSSIAVVAKDVGGNKGRTIEFDTVTGELQVKTLGGVKTVI